MGKKLIIPGADFSANGFRVSNLIDVKLKEGGTNPYKMYLLTNPVEMWWNINEPPTLPSGSIEKSISVDTVESLNSVYAGFIFGAQGESDNPNIGSLIVNFEKGEIAGTGICYGIKADSVDMRGISFADGANMAYMFAHASVKELKMPAISGGILRFAFYNFNADNISLNLHSDFTFIKKATELNSTFAYLKSKTADFSGIDVTTVEQLNQAFMNCVLEEIDLSTWHIDAVEYSSSMFRGCSNLKTIHLDNWNKTIEIAGRYADMFTNTPSLTKVFVTNCSSTIKTWLLARLNEVSAGGSNAWSETTVDGKACLTHS